MATIKKRVIHTSEAPSAIGPYSQAIEMNGTFYVSGQIPMDPVSGEITGENISEQTQQVLKNLTSILTAAGYTLKDVVKTTCYLSEMINFPEMNEVYAGFFSEEPPARATVEVNRLPKDVMVEIDAIACKGG
ncbi:MAG: RidA family protein [Bacteroidales bacterium]|nr:RidA family protein [Bacteroidales bacterium]